MIVIKWEKDDEEYEYYDLFTYTSKNEKVRIAYLYWSDVYKHWVLVTTIPKIKPKTRWYDNYNVNQLNEVFFRAVLDIQSDLNEIFYMCNDYNDAIHDYIIDYIQGINHNEN